MCNNRIWRTDVGVSNAFDNREGWIWFNGSFIPWNEAKTHIISQGLHYASAVFEGERVIYALEQDLATDGKELLKNSELSVIKSQLDKLKLALKGILFIRPSAFPKNLVLLS